MRLVGKINHVTLFSNCLMSVSFTNIQGEKNIDLVAELQKIKGESDKKFTVDGMAQVGEIASISIKNGVNMLVKINYDLQFLRRVGERFEKKNADDTTILVGSKTEDDLQKVLAEVSEKLSEPPGDLLRRTSKYHNRGGKFVNGETSIFRLSPGRQEVVLKKLQTLRVEKQEAAQSAP